MNRLPAPLPPAIEASKETITHRIQDNIRDLGHVVKQVIRGAKSHSLLDAVSKEFATLESTTDADKFKIERMNCYADELDLNFRAVQTALGKLDAVHTELTQASAVK